MPAQPANQMTPGPRNLLTDVPGILVGQAEDERVKTGVTVVTSPERFTAAVHVMGGAPGTRETDLLRPGTLVDQVDALVLSGGSAFGLDSASGVVAGLRAAGRGFVTPARPVPIVPAAILYDLANGGEDWEESPYSALGRTGFDAAGDTFDLGSAGAGVGATTAGLKGGLGSASAVLDDGTTVAALVAVNAVGGVADPETGQFWAAPIEIGAEFGGLGSPRKAVARTKLDPQPGQATTIAVVATDAALDPAQAQAVAMAAQDGMARAILPSHTLFDGDLIFAAATGRRPLADPAALIAISHAAACCLSRAIARGVYLARPAPGDLVTTWAQRFGG